jgi:oligoribonuclease (3'-5' exoribonuclease)
VKIKDLLEEERDFLASWSDLISTMHKVDSKLSKLHDVVIGDKEFGTEGIIQKLKNIETDLDEIKKYDFEYIEKQIEDLKTFKSKLIGFSVAVSVTAGFIWALILKLFDKN